MSREFCSNSPKIIAQIGALKPLAGSNLQNSLLISLLAGKWDAVRVGARSGGPGALGVLKKQTGVVHA